MLTGGKHFFCCGMHVTMRKHKPHHAPSLILVSHDLSRSSHFILRDIAPIIKLGLKGMAVLQPVLGVTVAVMMLFIGFFPSWWLCCMFVPCVHACVCASLVQSLFSPSLCNAVSDLGGNTNQRERVS